MFDSNSRWLWLYYPVSWFGTCVVLMHIAFFSWALLTPREVSGTLFGGAMGTQLYLGGWGAATLGLIVTILLKLPGSIFAWIAAGLVPLCIGGWWQLNYPDDANGNLIYSPEPSDIKLAMLIGVAIAASGLYVYSRIKAANKKASLSGGKIFAKTVAATVLAGFFIALPLAALKQQAMPHCAFNKDGQQLTACLGDGDTRVIVQ